VYPNPTADLTNLRIRIPESGKVTVRIVDGLGKTVHLEHGMQLEQGTTLLELDAAKWSAGRYHATVLYELDGKMEMKQLKIQVIR
jgi:flagellar hook assembly protein FlgD